MAPRRKRGPLPPRTIHSAQQMRELEVRVHAMEQKIQSLKLSLRNPSFLSLSSPATSTSHPKRRPQARLPSTPSISGTATARAPNSTHCLACDPQLPLLCWSYLAPNAKNHYDQLMRSGGSPKAPNSTFHVRHPHPFPCFPPLATFLLASPLTTERSCDHSCAASPRAGRRPERGSWSAPRRRPFFFDRSRGAARRVLLSSSPRPTATPLTPLHQASVQAAREDQRPSTRQSAEEHDSAGAWRSWEDQEAGPNQQVGEACVAHRYGARRCANRRGAVRRVSLWEWVRLTEEERRRRGRKGWTALALLVRQITHEHSGTKRRALHQLDSCMYVCMYVCHLRLYSN